MLKLRRGIVVAGRSADGRVGDEERAGLGRRGAGRRGRERRRGDRQHRGARPRARLGRLRHRPRQPDPRARRAAAPSGAHVMKLNYTLAPAPGRPGRGRATASRDRGAEAAGPACSRCTASWRRPPGRPRRRAPGLRVGYVQTAGGALPGRALARRRRAARARAALRPRHRRRRLRRRARGDQRCRRRSTRPPGRLGWDAAIVGPGPGILGSATRSATAAWRRSTPPTRRWRSACRRCSARGCRAATRARATAASATTPRRCCELLLGAGARAGPRGRARGLADARRDGAGWRLGEAALDELIASARASRLAVEAIDLDGYAASGLPATDDGPRRSTRTRSSSPRALAAGRRARGGGDGGARLSDGAARGRRKLVYEGQIARRARSTTFRYADGEAVEREVVVHPGAVGDRRPRRPRTSTWCASRARPSASRRCSSCRPASSTSRARRRSSARSASWPRRSARPAGDWRELKRFYTSPGLHRRAGRRSSSRPSSSDVAAPSPTPRSGSRSSSWPLARPRRRDRRAARTRRR